MLPALENERGLCVYALPIIDDDSRCSDLALDSAGQRTVRPTLEIVATSRKDLRSHLTSTAAVITFAGVGTGEAHPKLPPGTRRLRIKANDIEHPGQSSAPGGGVLFSERDARRILAFASSLPSGVETLIVQCRGGASRSVAVASALRVLRGEEAPKSLYNRHIFETIVRVAGQ